MRRSSHSASAAILAAAVALLMTAGEVAAQSFSSARVLKPSAYVSVDRVAPGSSFQIAIATAIDAGWHVNSHTPSYDYLIATELKLSAVEGLTFREPIYPAHIEKAFAFSDGKTLKVYDGEFLIGVDIGAGAALPPGPMSLKGTLTAQACNDESCLAPGKIPVEIPILIAAPGESLSLTNVEIFKRIAFLGAAAPPGGASGTGAGAGSGSGDIGAVIGARGLLLALPLIFLGGLALNLTPCVYPLIPITVSYFGGQASGKPLRTFGLSSVYVLGMAITYSSLGALAASTGGLLGAALQNPWVLGFVAAVLVALALSMFGFFEIQLPGFIVNRIGSRQGALGALFMGLTVGLVAAPCIGPFVVGLLAYVSQTGNPVTGFVMFFVLALGLGLPFLILGTFSGALATLPRAGGWMIWVRSLFGCVLIGMAIYFLKPVLPDAAARIGLGLLIAGSGVFLAFFERTEVRTRLFRGVRLATAVAGAAGAAWILFPASGEAAAVTWQAYDDAALSSATRAGRPVIIDFSAEWCIACKELEHDTFTDPAVRAEAERFTTLRADLTSYASPPVEAIKKRFGILGLPWVVFLGSDGAERADLRVTGFVPPQDFLSRMRQVK